ncbi:MAG: bifunctional oligoribonuclease/PAP phosphatase NrnA [Flavobacteriales bacterium]|nr:bifunctional oligoribonuclease/PAP phosphatase NrnA [Flavobacteriales bacterium]
MDKDLVKRALELCEAHQPIVITGHKSPDGDAVGSTLGLSRYLKKKGLDVTVILPDGFPNFLKWMPEDNEVLIYEDHIAVAKEKIDQAKLIFTLDYNDLSRVGEMTASLQASDATKIMIDHHQQPSDYAEITFSDTSACSTAQMVYEFIEAADDVSLIDLSIAECLYCGIVTDSGSFRFPSVTAKTHEIVAGLMKAGLNHSKVNMSIYDTNLLERLRLVGYALSEKLEVIEDGRVALIWLSKKELDDHHYRPGDTEGLVNQALSIKGVNCAAFIKEGNNLVKMSLRSKGKFSVNELAREHFDGGGHTNAAGGAFVGMSVQKAVETFKHVISNYKDELDYEM